MRAEPGLVKEVARQAGVTRSTVFLAYRKPEQVGAGTRARIFAAAKVLGYNGPGNGSGPAPAEQLESFKKKDPPRGKPRPKPAPPPEPPKPPTPEEQMLALIRTGYSIPGAARRAGVNYEQVVKPALEHGDDKLAWAITKAVRFRSEHVSGWRTRHVSMRTEGNAWRRSA